MSTDIHRTLEITDLHTMPDGHLSYRRGGIPCLGDLPLLLVHYCWHRGMDLDDLADGFGPGSGTHGDWSAVRDSTQDAQDKMLARALNWLGVVG